MYRNTRRNHLYQGNSGCLNPTQQAWSSLHPAQLRENNFNLGRHVGDHSQIRNHEPTKEMLQKLSKKWWTASALMRAWFEIVSFPTTILSMVLKLPQILADKWQNLVFLFPLESHLILDFCLQWSSSACKRLCSSTLSSERWDKIEYAREESMADWRQRILSSASFKRYCRLPNNSLFQDLRAFLKAFSLWKRTN